MAGSLIVCDASGKYLVSYCLSFLQEISCFIEYFLFAISQRSEALAVDLVQNAVDFFFEIARRTDVNFVGKSFGASRLRFGFKPVWHLEIFRFSGSRVS